MKACQLARVLDDEVEVEEVLHNKHENTRNGCRTEAYASRVYIASSGVQFFFCGPFHRFRETAKGRERSELKAVETKAKDMLRLAGAFGAVQGFLLFEPVREGVYMTICQGS